MVQPDYSVTDQDNPAVNGFRGQRREDSPDSGRRPKTDIPSAKSQRKIKSAIDLPEDMVYEIFLRLPVKSLYRFRCVSKGLCGMVDSPTFVQKHNLQKHNNNNNNLHEQSSSEDYAIISNFHSFLMSIKFFDDLKRADPVKLDPTPYSHSSKMCLLGCCNGVFLFQEEDDVSEMHMEMQDYWDLLLWNPSNNTSKKVQCPYLLPPPPISFHEGKGNIVISVGYDYVNGDYKIIRSEFTNDTKSLQLYSFRKGSWNNFHGIFPPGNPTPLKARRNAAYSNSKWSGICVSSAMHWLWINPIDSSRFIAVFDLVSESFRSLPLPEIPGLLGMRPIHLLDFGGRLCVTFLPLRDDDVTPTAWVMESYGIETSWSPLYTYTGKRKRNCKDVAKLSFFYFPNKERRLFCINTKTDCDDNLLSWWNPVKHSFRCVGRYRSHVYDCCSRLYEYVIYERNLVRLDKELI